ncbi:MAG: DUF664 domain-containing protein [Acidimicrobiia bacterium]|nr:DUF664 domain-containing protein [Acidimicrobiia bacterium]
MDATELLTDAFRRVEDLVRTTVDGLDADGLTYRPDAEANPIGWLVWHLTRIEDDHVAEIAGREQAWTAAGWADAFGMSPDPDDTGFGHTSEQVAAHCPTDSGLLVDYHEVVSARTREWLDAANPDDLDRVIDRRWDPPVTVGVRLVSVIGDALQHLGQAAYVRGLWERR